MFSENTIFPHSHWWKSWGFPGTWDGKESTWNAGNPERSPGEGNGKPTPVFLPGKSHGQRRLVDYSLWGHKSSDTTERLSACAHTHTHSFRLGFLLLLLSHFFLIFLQLWFPGTSLVVQWLRLCASKAVGQRLDISLVREPRSHWFMLPGTASKKKRPWFHWRSCHQIVPPHPSSLQLSTDPWGVPSLSLNPPTSGSYSFHLYSCHHFWL